MRRFINNIAVKITLFILLSVSLFFLVTSAIGIVFCFENNVFADGGEHVKERISNEFLYDVYSEVEDYVRRIVEKKDASHLAYDYEPYNTNVRFTAFSDTTGYVWASNIKENESLRLELIDTLNVFIASNSSIKNDSIVLDSFDDVPKIINELESKCRIVELSTFESSTGKIIMNYEYQEGRYQEVTLKVGLLSKPVVNDILAYRLLLADFFIKIIEKPLNIVLVAISAFLLTVIFW